MTENRIGPPVRGKEFYGRDKFVKLVSDQLRNGHVLLAAPRRLGCRFRRNRRSVDHRQLAAQ